MSIRPFFSYLGGKWRSAPKYPPPFFDTLVEPFAGSAGYACRFPHLRVVLVDKSEAIAGVWSYLIRASEREILALPLVPPGSHVDEHAWPCPEARDLVGFCINRGADGPRRTATQWGRDRPLDGWSLEARERVASQLHAIRHWRIECGEYSIAPDVEATWFIDPPYKAVDKYRWGARYLDFDALAAWCRSRRGQVMVCEAQGATWLPFVPFGNFARNHNKPGGPASSRFGEALWLSGHQGSGLWLPGAVA